MAFKCRRVSGRRVRGRTMKRRRIVRRRRMVRPMVASFIRRTWAENWAFSTVSTSGFYKTYLPTLSALTNVAEYTSLYDLYKINAVKITFTPRWDGFDAGSAATVGVNCPILSWYVDPYAYVGPTGTYSSATYNSFLEAANGRVRSRQMNKSVSVYWKPKVLDSGVATNQFKRCPWLSTANNTQQMRQLFVFLHDANFANAIPGFSMDVEYTLYFQCKAQR